jgi:hypothetical protein
LKFDSIGSLPKDPPMLYPSRLQAAGLHRILTYQDPQATSTAPNQSHSLAREGAGGSNDFKLASNVIYLMLGHLFSHCSKTNKTSLCQADRFVEFLGMLLSSNPDCR